MASAWSMRRSIPATSRPASRISCRGGAIAAAAPSYLWVVNFADLSTQKIPRTDSNDINPMWIGDKVYFLSDRDGPMTLFRYDPQSKQVTKLLPNTGKDIVHASAGPGGIVYEQFGAIHIYDLATNKEHPVAIDIMADLTEVRPRFQNVASQIANARISPTGARAVFEAHGEILTAPAEKGDIRNLTNTPGVMERSPAWSPDGKSIAYFSDASGEYALHIRPQNGGGEPQKIALAGNAAYYFEPEVVARQQADRVHGQSAAPVGGGGGGRQADARSIPITCTSSTATSPGRRIRSGSPSRRRCRTGSARFSFTRSRAARARRSPTG